jgi:catechol 1,2-dioxygenase
MITVLTQIQVLKDGYKPITTQIFDKDSKYLDDDSVFAVKDSLVVEFVPREGDSNAKKELKYDLLVAPISAGGVGTESAPSGIHAAE